MNLGWSLNIKFGIISVTFALPTLLLWAFVDSHVEGLRHDQDYYQALALAAVGWVLCNGLALILLRNIIRSLRLIAHELQAVTRETLGSSLELDESSKKSAAAAHQEATAIQQSVTAMTEMTSMLGQTGQHTRATKEVAEQSLDRAQEGAQTMQELAHSMHRIAQANTNLKDIRAIIDSIAARTTIINDIVFKTQLLSVNASIEAARAGHHGKGFAVVAGEVASLANLSGKAAEEIRDLLKKSRGEVAEILASTQESIASGQSVVRDALDSFEAITSAMNHINEKVQQIFEATREQEIGVRQTTDALAELNRATSAQSSLASRNTKLSEHLKEQGYHLRRIERAMSFVIAGETSGLKWGQELQPQRVYSPSAEPQSTFGDERVPALELASESAYISPNESSSRKSELAARIVRKAHGHAEGVLMPQAIGRVEEQITRRFAWSEAYDIHVESMNGEHKILLRLMDSLEQAVKEGLPLIEQRRILLELRRYTEKHFLSEEQFLESIHYPELKQHQLIHKNLLERLDTYAEAFERDGAFLDDFFQFLQTWLAAHIQGVDMKYGQYANDRKSVA